MTKTCMKTKTKMAFKVWTIYVEHLISYCHFYNIHKKVLTKIHFKMELKALHYSQNKYNKFHCMKSSNFNEFKWICMTEIVNYLISAWF